MQLLDPALSCAVNFLSVNPGITFANQRSIITRLTLSQQVNLQFLHTLGSLIYIYVFGDRMGQVSLSGLSFQCECPGLSSADPSTDLGAEKMMSWYQVNRASYNPSPIRLTIGKTVIQGFVLNFVEDVVDTSLRLVQWGVTMAALPPSP